MNCRLTNISTLNKISAFVATFGAKFDDMVSTLDNIRIVFNHYDTMASLNQGIKGVEQTVDVVKVKTCGWFVKDE